MELTPNAQKFKEKKIERDRVISYSNERLIIGYNGGTFKITAELIMFLKSFKETSHPIFDKNGRPVMIEDIPRFINEIEGRYYETVLEAWEDWQEIDKEYE